jgi:hypothetical protein
MQQMRGLSIYTGIYKAPRTTRVFCSSTGLESDEHDLTFHGGVDKAVHQYFPGHYKDWKREHPDAEEAFEVGGFGENLVASGSMNERNVCIGDIVRVGGQDGVLLQVSLPRVSIILFRLVCYLFYWSQESGRCSGIHHDYLSMYQNLQFAVLICVAATLLQAKPPIWAERVCCPDLEEEPYGVVLQGY